MRIPDRRKRRSNNTTRALGYQLDTCRRASMLEGIVVSDENGLCLAKSGNTDACDEVAARLPMMGRKVRDFAGVMYSAERGYKVRMRRFHVGQGELYVCAIGGRSDQRDRQVMHSISGVSRILG